MNLQYLFYYLSFLSLFIGLSSSSRNKDLVTMKTGLGEVSPCSVGLQLFAILNNTAEENYFVELIADECCINSDEVTDCDSVEIIGETSDVIQKGNTKKFSLVAPLLDPYERDGYCIIHVDSRPLDKVNNLMRDTITIHFNTMLKNVDENTEHIKKCKNADEDPLNDCKPVNCEIYYNGKKPIFDTITKRCIEVPKCRNKKSESSNVFDPINNRYMQVAPINDNDIENIKSINNNNRHDKDIIIVESPDEVTNTLVLDAENTKEDKKKNNAGIRKKFSRNVIVQYMMSNKCTLVALGLVILVQCCCICAMIFWMRNSSKNRDQKKVERKYFNYRQDVSVTTPLIATSNIDTETALDYASESSNVENKIKCYKSCQKERKNDTKISMSDDILAKCLNRRNWNSKPKSETAKEVNNQYINNFNAEWKALQSNIKKTIEEPVKEKKVLREEKGTGTETKPKHKRDYRDDLSGGSSEKFIKCHDYNFVQSINIGKNFEKPSSILSEKAAQACFSNDSIDDFLSERGMVHLTGDQLSKYSFTSNSTSRSESSSKTSKNRNLVKNVLSYLSKRSKKYTSSDPGVKPEDGKDLELIHMSRASMYSSSVSEYRNMHGIRLAKDSKSTF